MTTGIAGRKSRFSAPPHTAHYAHEAGTWILQPELEACKELCVDASRCNQLEVLVLGSDGSDMRLCRVAPSGVITDPYGDDSRALSRRRGKVDAGLAVTTCW